MTRNEYLTRLAELLQDIPAEERVAAMEYYNDYFDDAGGENEQQVIRELGSPEQVAAEVKAGLGKTESKNEEASHTETYRDPVNDDRQTSYSYGNNPQYRNGNPMPEKKESWISNGWKIALVVLLVIILIPVGGPLVVSVIGTLFGLIAAAFFIFIALVIVAICLVIAGVILAGNGILAIGTSFAAACVIIGIGLILAAIGCAATVGTIWLCTIALPVMYHFIVNLCRKPFQKKGGAA